VSRVHVCDILSVFRHARAGRRTDGVVPETANRDSSPESPTVRTFRKTQRLVARV